MRVVLVAGAALFCFASVALAEAVNICGVGPSSEASITPGASVAAADGAQACTCTDVKIAGKATEDRDEAEDRAELSGVVVDKDKTRLIGIANEGFGPGKRDHALQIFEGDLAQGYVFKKDITLFEVPEGFCNEADFEGLTAATATCSPQPRIRATAKSKLTIPAMTRTARGCPPRASAAAPGAINSNSFGSTATRFRSSRT